MTATIEQPAVRERPLIFTAESVRAILAGAKTQSRRVCKPQPGPDIDPCRLRACEPMRRGRYAFMGNDNLGPRCEISLRPYAFPGDLLWVRESWAQGVGGPIYRADWGDPAPGGNYPAHPDAHWLSDVQRACGADVHQGGWRSPMFMPRWASRLTLELTSVRVERLNEISGLDAWAEGVNPPVKPGIDVDIDGGLSASGLQAGIDAFRATWDRINGRRPGAAWKDNPWVFVLEFRRVEGNP